MSYEFTKLSDIPIVAEFPEGANTVIETNGEIKRCPSSGGGGMSYDVIVTSTDGGATLTITHGTYADLKTKIEAHEPAHVLLLMDVVNEGATGRYQVPALSIAMDGGGEISGIIYMAGQPGFLGLFILPDGTAEIRV